MKRRVVLTSAVALAFAFTLNGCKKEEQKAVPKTEAPKAAAEATFVKIGSASPLTGRGFTTARRSGARRW